MPARSHSPKDSVQPEEIETILAVKLDHVGDVILATPVLDALRQAYPKAHIRTVVGSWSELILKGNPNIDEVLVYDPPWLNRELLAGKAPPISAGNRDTLRRLANTRHDLVVNLRISDLHHNLFCSQFADKYLLAHETGTPHDALATHLAPAGPKTHVREYHKKLLARIGLKLETTPRIYCSDADHEWAKKTLPGFNPRVAIFTGAGVPLKKWPERKFMELCRRLSGLGCELVLIGSDAEQDFCNRVDAKLEVQNLCGKTNLLQLAAILSRVTILLSNDSAPVHVADAVTTPVVVITKPNSIKEFSPWGKGHAVLSKKKCDWGMHCPGFVFDNPRHLPKSCRCIEDISVDEVERVTLQKLQQLLQIET
jgi:heptosyltransferase-2/heptosyltransferase-3